jgi:AGZA family xanthine/uracil permease-like MFS transporter
MNKIPFVRGDIDGFFGLFIDNLVQLMVIYALCSFVLEFPPELVVGRILPGAALSIIIGNIFYAWQAKKLMDATGRDDVTALPYGINTPSVFAFIFFVMVPVYFGSGKNVTLAWQAGLFACFTSGLMEIAGAFVGDVIRRRTPRAALLAPLAGIAITFICMGFVFRIFQNPAIAFIPMLLILIAYGSRVALPLGMPGGLVAVLVGVAIAWISRAAGMDYFPVAESAAVVGIYPPTPVFSDVFSMLNSEQFWGYMAIIVPMALFNIIGSLQNLESAEAAGDSYATRPSLLCNGIGTVVASLFGSPFPTTIYIGHPGWKAMGARAGYSMLNAVVIGLLCFTGGIVLVQKLVPLEATLGILLWIGIIIMAQSFESVPKKHYLALAVGLVPCFGAWAYVLIDGAVGASGKTLYEVAGELAKRDIYIEGVIAMNQGFLLSSMILAAVMVCVVDRDFKRGAIWLAAGAACSFVGLIHAYEFTETGVVNKFGFMAAPEFTVTYALSALIMLGMGMLKSEAAEDSAPTSE